MDKYILKMTVLAEGMSMEEAQEKGYLNRVDAEKMFSKGGIMTGVLVQYENGYQSWMPEDVFNSARSKNSTFLERLVAERDELVEKMEKLTIFLKSDIFMNMNDYARDLLMEQYRIMISYVDCLNRRIKAH